MKLVGATSGDVSIQRGRIAVISNSPPEIDVSNHIILPGLINAHDHLEFSLFPRLGRRHYPNAAAWAKDIYKPDKPPVEEHRRVRKPIRLQWGGIQNLINGVTTVAHHNPYEPAFDRGFPVRVVRSYGWAHSLHFSPDLVKRFRATPARSPFIVHAAEGTDADSRGEIETLDKKGVLGPRTVLVHATALDSAGLEIVRQRRASIVWCPSSNVFTLGRTVSPEVLHSGVPIALGTDSSLTSAGGMAAELKFAREFVPPDDLFAMVTWRAAQILRLTSGEGEIREGGVADLIAVRDSSHMHPELTIIGGKIKLVSAHFAERLPDKLKAGLNPILVEGAGAWLVDADIPALMRATEKVLGRNFRLGHKRVCA
ncbi:MAG TPA: amidohydrolase family protein [Bryobacteraceae bacterium]|nr:amidohydrolase family protein [Bryobacteraceae bacterium]